MGWRVLEQMRTISTKSSILLVLGLLAIASLAAYFVCWLVEPLPPSDLIPWTPPPARSCIALHLDSGSSLGLIELHVCNASGRRLRIGWDAYSKARFLGQFKFVVRSESGRVIPIRSGAEHVYTTPGFMHSLLYGVVRSGAATYVLKGHALILTFNLNKLFDLKKGQAYSVYVVFTPDQSSTLTASVRSNVASLLTTGRSDAPALSFTITDRRGYRTQSWEDVTAK